MSDNPPLVIELFGQPGAGKSTLVRAAAPGSELQTTAQLGAAWRRQSSFDKGMLAGRAILGGSCLARAITLAREARLFRADSLSRLLRLVIKSRWVRSQTGTLLLEEGHLQEIWSIFYSAGRTQPEPHQLAPLIACLYRGLDAHIYFLDADPDLAFDRIRGRAHGKSRLDRLAEPDLRRRLAATAQLPHRIVDAAKLAGLGVSTIDAAMPIEATVTRLREIHRL